MLLLSCNKLLLCYVIWGKRTNYNKFIQLSIYSHPVYPDMQLANSYKQ